MAKKQREAEANLLERIRSLSRHEAAHAVTLLQSGYGDMLEGVVFDSDGGHNVVPGGEIPLDVRAKVYVAGAVANGATFETFSTCPNYEDDYKAFCLCVQDQASRKDSFLAACRLVKDILRTPGYAVVAKLLEETCREVCRALQVDDSRSYEIDGAKIRKVWAKAYLAQFKKPRRRAGA